VRRFRKQVWLIVLGVCAIAAGTFSVRVLFATVSVGFAQEIGLDRDLRPRSSGLAREQRRSLPVGGRSNSIGTGFAWGRRAGFSSRGA